MHTDAISCWIEVSAPFLFLLMPKATSWGFGSVLFLSVSRSPDKPLF